MIDFRSLVTEGPESMSDLLEAYGGVSCGLAPDDAETGTEMDAARLVQLAFSSGAETILKILQKRAPAEFPAVIPALEALLVDVAEVRHYTGSLWDLPGGLKPGFH
jgi:hypothetical protein